MVTTCWFICPGGSGSILLDCLLHMGSLVFSSCMVFITIGIPSSDPCVEVTEPQNSWSWKRPFKVILSNLPAQGESARRGCPGPCPDGFQIFPKKLEEEETWKQSNALLFLLTASSWGFFGGQGRKYWKTSKHNCSAERKLHSCAVQKINKKVVPSTLIPLR